MPEQDPIPPRRGARRRSPGEDDDVPPWANLPPVRPPRRGTGVGDAPHRGPRPRRDPDSYREAPPHREAPPRHAPPQYDSGPRLVAGYLGGPPGPPATDLPNPGRTPYQAPGPDDFQDSEPPAFAPDEDEAPPPGRQRALGARARRALLRRRRRSQVMVGTAVVVIAAVISVVLLNQGGGQAANISSDFITSFQPGELRGVPNACDVIPAGTVRQYLPGQVKEAAPQPINSDLGSGSACNWTLDHQPAYRLLEVNVLAYAPNLLPAGNGSATSAATDAYTAQYQELQTPPKGGVSGQATVTPLPGVGDAAFSAMQVFHVGGAISDTATVVIRFRNVIVQAELSGLEHSNKGHYGPVSQSQLSQGALAFAQAAYASLHL